MQNPIDDEIFLLVYYGGYGYADVLAMKVEMRRWLIDQLRLK